MKLKLPSSGDSGNRRRLIAVAAVALALAVVALGWQALAPKGEDPTVVKLPDTYHFRCTKCNHEWTADEKHVTNYFGGLPTTLSPVDCPSCKQKGCAYLMTRCHYCGKYYIHPHLLLANPPARPNQDICPHCKKDNLK